MNPVEIMIKTAQLEAHVKALRVWRLQEAVALAATLREQRLLMEQIDQLNRAIDGAELELEFLKGIGKIR
jgi:hypothetical protein